MISCVITTRNEEPVIENLLKSIKNQSSHDWEIIVVDNNSRDNTKTIANSYTNRVFNKGPERSVQRNFGVSKAKGEYILILDADMVLTKEVLKDCNRKMKKNPGLGALIIPEKSFGERFWAKCKAFEREFYVGENSFEAPRLFRKKLFTEFGGYATDITGPEDYDLPLRMRKSGVKIGRVKSYILHNEKRFSVLGSAKKKFYYAAHARKYLARHPEMAVVQGMMLLRPVFLRKWRKLTSHPVLAAGMFWLKGIEFMGALSGIFFGIFRDNGIISTRQHG